MQNCTVVNNTADSNGGGIRLYQGTLVGTIESSIVAGNVLTGGSASPKTFSVSARPRVETMFPCALNCVRKASSCPTAAPSR